jgi:hypothetical protein
MSYDAKTRYFPKRKLPPDEVSSVRGAGDLDSTFSSQKRFFPSSPLISQRLPCSYSLQACTRTILKLGDICDGSSLGRTPMCVPYISSEVGVHC